MYGATIFGYIFYTFAGMWMSWWGNAKRKEFRPQVEAMLVSFAFNKNSSAGRSRLFFHVLASWPLRYTLSGSHGPPPHALFKPFLAPFTIILKCNPR